MAATGRAVPAQSAQELRRIAAPRQREQHPGAQVHVGVHARQRGADHDEVHDAGGVPNAGMGEHADERALRNDFDAGRRPGNRRDDDEQRQHVEREQAEHHGPQGRGNGDLRVLRFTRSNGNHLDAVERENADDDGHPHAAEAVRQEAARQPGQVVKARAGHGRGRRWWPRPG